MITCELTITNKTGLHARPATLWVKEAVQFQSKIQLKKGDKTIDGKSMLGILSLGLGQGTAIELIADGPDEAEAVSRLQQLLADLSAKGE